MHSKQRRQPRPRSGPRHKGTAPPRAKGQGHNHGPQPVRPIRAAAHTSAGRVAPGERLRGRFPFALKTKHLGPGRGARPQPRRKAPATRPPQTARPRLPPPPPSNAASTRASLALFWCLFAPNHQQRQRGRKGREKQKREEKSTYILYSDNFSLMPPLCPQLAPNLPPKISIAKNLLFAISF